MKEYSLAQAAILIGVPPMVLATWAFARTGPKNVGTRMRPRYKHADLDEWLSRWRVELGRSLH
jgi:hypothetical protein